MNSDSGFTSLLASLTAHREHNKQNRQTVEGEKHKGEKIGNPERRHGGRCGLEIEE